MNMKFSQPEYLNQEKKLTVSMFEKIHLFKILKMNIKNILIFVSILFILSSAVFFGNYFLNRKIDDRFSAVFLTNGQVYFGKIVKNNDLEIVLNNVFYIQINENTTKEEIANNIKHAKFNLVKLGDEMHGPTDELFINRSQVVFYEYLRDDSKVVESIKSFKK